MRYIGSGMVTGGGRVAIAALTVVIGLTLILALPQAGKGQSTDERVIYLAAIEPKGGVTIDKEPFPTTPLPKGGG